MKIVITNILILNFAPLFTIIGDDKRSLIFISMQTGITPEYLYSVPVRY